MPELQCWEQDVNSYSFPHFELVQVAGSEIEVKIFTTAGLRDPALVN